MKALKPYVQLMFLGIVMMSLFGCVLDSEHSQYGVRSQPILNGTRVTGDDHLAVVGLVQELNRDDYAEFCTGALISPEYVLTAAHCVADCDDGSESVEKVRWRMRVGVGQSVLTYRKVTEISEYHIHPDYVCNGDVLENDIAVLKLSESVSRDIAPNVHPMGKNLDLTADEIDSEDGVSVNIFGFGRTGADDPLSTGSKYIIQSQILARCPLEGGASEHCDEEKTRQKGMLYFDASEGGTCLGDSGGPAILRRNGLEFVVGVTSYGYPDCKFINANALVSDYESFISQFVPILQSWPNETCSDGTDDDGDGYVDCDDSDCLGEDICVVKSDEPEESEKEPSDNPEASEERESESVQTSDETAIDGGDSSSLNNRNGGGCSMNESNVHLPYWICFLLFSLVLRRRNEM